MFEHAARQPPVFREGLEESIEISAGHILHDKKKLIGVLERVLQTRDEGVPHPQHHTPFRKKVSDPSTIQHVLLQDDLLDKQQAPSYSKSNSFLLARPAAEETLPPVEEGPLEFPLTKFGPAAV